MKPFHAAMFPNFLRDIIIRAFEYFPKFFRKVPTLTVTHLIHFRMIWPFGTIKISIPQPDPKLFSIQSNCNITRLSHLQRTKPRLEFP